MPTSFLPPSANLEHLVGGLAGGFVSTLICHPLDLLKIRFAANDGQFSRPQYKGYWHALRSIVAIEGYRGLYQGLNANLIASTASWGLYFQFYNISKDVMRSSFGVKDLSPVHHLCAGVVAGTSMMAVTNPIWLVKTRLCLQYETQPKQYSGVWDALTKFFKAEGIAGLYRGFIPAALSTIQGGLQFMAYDYLKERKYRQLGVPSGTKLNTIDYILYSSSAKIFAVTTAFPYQLIRTRMRDHNVRYSGTFDVIVRTYRREGVGGFYKGLLPGNLRVLPSVCITFVVYENIVHFLHSS